MFQLTRRHAFTFMLLGYLVWRGGTGYEEVIPEYRQCPESCAYKKIWSELPPKDRAMVEAIGVSSEREASDIRGRLGMKNNLFSPGHHCLRR